MLCCLLSLSALQRIAFLIRVMPLAVPSPAGPPGPQPSPRPRAGGWHSRRSGDPRSSQFRNRKVSPGEGTGAGEPVPDDLRQRLVT